MAYFLAKTDPETYSIEDLAQEGRTTWDGVRSPQALQAIRAMRPGDQVVIYHSMGNAAVVGLAQVVSDPQPDPKEPKLWVVDLEFKRKLARPVTLKEIKESGQFNDWSLVRQSRLSTMTAPASFMDWLKDKEQS
jgi:predicted RNA-binding protein with PUA-like domain